jgi:hypothetical protein
MIALKVEKLGDRLAVVLTEDALKTLHVSEGDLLCVETMAERDQPSWAEDPHARGRAFLRRYTRNLAQQ